MKTWERVTTAITHDAAGVSVWVREAELSISEIAGVSFVRREDYGALLLVAAIALSPLALLCGWVLLASPELARWVRPRFYRRASKRHGPRALDDDPQPVGIVQFTARRAWWLSDTAGRHRALMLESPSGEIVVLGGGWPPGCEAERGAHAKWIVYRHRTDHVVLGTRAWGRCSTRHVELPDGIVGPFVDHVTIATAPELAPPLRDLISASTPYR